MTKSEFYTPGNVIYSGYWGTYDLVLGYQEDAHGFIDYVKVCKCTVDGLALEPWRTHCTSPFRLGKPNGDRIVSTGHSID